MNTTRLEEFALLANVLNYSKAAERLFISQPMLSRHIKELEQELDTVLFERDTHSVRLTDEGKYFLKWVEPFLRRASRAEAALSDHRAEGQVRILCAEQSLTTLVLGFLREFRENYPKTTLSVAPITAASRREMIYSCDVMLTPCDFLSFTRQDAEGVLLTSQDPLLAIGPYHPLGDLQELHLEQLQGETLVVPYADEMFGPYARNAALASRKCRGQLRKLTAENPQAGLLTVELGEGVMLIPHHLKYRIYPLTRTVPVTDPDCSFPIYAYHSCDPENPAAQFFFEKLREAFEKK